MFNLIVSGRVENDRRGFILADRVFGYTSGEVERHFVSGTDIDFHSLMRHPALLMEEGRGNEVARIAWLSRVTRNGPDYQLDYAIDGDIPKLSNADIDALQSELEMHDWELGTNHWAIKDVDLFEVLLRKSTKKKTAPSVFTLSEGPVIPNLV